MSFNDPSLGNLAADGLAYAASAPGNIGQKQPLVSKYVLGDSLYLFNGTSIRLLYWLYLDGEDPDVGAFLPLL